MSCEYMNVKCWPKLKNRQELFPLESTFDGISLLILEKKRQGGNAISSNLTARTWNLETCPDKIIKKSVILVEDQYSFISLFTFTSNHQC